MNEDVSPMEKWWFSIVILVFGGVLINSILDDSSFHFEVKMVKTKKGFRIRFLLLFFGVKEEFMEQTWRFFSLLSSFSDKKQNI